MKLEGSLDAFSLPDVFQLLSFTKKTGGLHLSSDGCDGVVFFTAGQITGASSDTSRQPLARRLIGSGAVDDGSLGAAVQRARDDENVGVVRALLEANAVEAELLRQAVSDQSVDAVFDLLQWQTGEFAFVMDEVNPDDVGVSVQTETVVADADARRASWETVSQLVPSPTAILSMPVLLPDDPDISRDEWALLALIDGRRSVNDLVDLTGCGRYAVVSTLAGLVSRSLLEVREDGDDHVSVVVRRQELLGPVEVSAAAPVTKPAAPPAAAPASPPAARSGDQDDAAADALAEDVRADAPADAPAAPAESADEPDLVKASAGDGPMMLGGAHVPGDVVPPRSEPFLPRRQAEFDDGSPAAANRSVPHATPGGSGGAGSGDVVGATALEPQPSLIERDPSVNRSLMLRLIAGVRGL
jgi:Domain of unknown function (DUF4388)